MPVGVQTRTMRTLSLFSVGFAVLALAGTARHASPRQAARFPDFGADAFTVSAWIRTTTGGTILARCPASGLWAPQAKSLFVREGKLCFDLGWVGVLTSDRTVADGRWHHVALTGPKPYALFIDGTPDASADLAGAPDPEGFLLRVGRTNDNFPEPTAFTGDIAGLEIRATRLDPPEIVRLAALGPPDPGSNSNSKSNSKSNSISASVAPDGALRLNNGILSLDGATGLDVEGSAIPSPPPDTAGICRSLRAAIRTLSDDHGSYPRAALLSRLAALERRAGPQPTTAWYRDLAALQREALVDRNPLLACGKILFVKRKTYQASHYYTEYIDGCRYFGGGLCVLDLRTGAVRDVVPSLSRGIFGRFDLSFDAKRVVFDWKESLDKGFRIWEVGVDGTGLRQITFPDPEEAELARTYRTVGTPTGIPYLTGTDDMHPCYLPNGDIAFVTTRCRKGILCDEPDVLTTTTLYRMDRLGRNMRPLSYNTVSEATPSVTADGRILYTRWEYVDKGGSACKCIWQMNPDGSMPAEVYANNVTHPTTFLDARDIPGTPGGYFVVGAPHMPMGVGSIIRLNTAWPVRTLLPMTYLTPEIRTPDESGYRHLRRGTWVFDNQGPLFREPYPLSRDFCLVTHNPDQDVHAVAAYGIWMLDSFGNRVPVYRDPETSCWQAMPLRPRPRPAALPETQAPARTTMGTLLLQDVYAGLDGIERGRVKWLRVMEDVPRPWSARRFWPGDGRKQQHAVISKDGHLAPKIVHGVVPVLPDGSAHFRVPANRNVFLQALDADHMELQRMRTFVNVRPGETRGCVGCHEDKARTPSAGWEPYAMRRKPDIPHAEAGQLVPRAVHYPTDVQPVLDRHCVGCHAGPTAGGGLDLTGDHTDQFSRSYENMIDRKLAGNVVDEIGEKHGNIEAAPPLTYGSHTSKLAALLRKGHHGVKLPEADWIRLVTWIDANAPYYGTWEGRRNRMYRDRPDYRPGPPEPLTQSPLR